MAVTDEKLKVPITLPGMKAQRKKLFARTTTKKKIPQNQKNLNQTKKAKTIHIDAYSCINVKKKTLNP